LEAVGSAEEQEQAWPAEQDCSVVAAESVCLQCWHVRFPELNWIRIPGIPNSHHAHRGMKESQI
jgi:hypothetical protein